MKEEWPHDDGAAPRRVNRSLTEGLAMRIGFGGSEATKAVRARHDSQRSALGRTCVKVDTDCDQPAEHLVRRLHEPLSFLLRPCSASLGLDPGSNRNAEILMERDKPILLWCPV